ncbi:MAG: hypothetical protein ACTSXQ_06110 [Alphaproteobacteria bacterium]
MRHPRESIRDAFVERLGTAVDTLFPTMAKERVYANRVKPLFNQFFPAILLYTQEEDVEEERWGGDGFYPLRRNLTVEIEAVVKGDDDVDNTLDLFAWQIETALDGWNIPYRGADILRLKRTESAIVIDGSKTYGVICLTYSVMYRTEAKQPDLSGPIPTNLTVRENINAS